MKSLLVNEVLGPLVRRAGTAVAAYLVAKGVDAGAADQIVLGLSTACLVSVDLLLSHIARR